MVFGVEALVMQGKVPVSIIDDQAMRQFAAQLNISLPADQFDRVR
jgi:hypothetical protein